MARPSKCTKEYILKAREYLTNWKDQGDAIPSAVGLAFYLDVAESTIYEHSKKNKEFSEIVRKLNGLQQRQLINGGLTNELNANIAKLILGKHGYHDKQDQNVTQADKPNVSVEFKPVKRNKEPEGTQPVDSTNVVSIK